MVSVTPSANRTFAITLEYTSSSEPHCQGGRCYIASSKFGKEQEGLRQNRSALDFIFLAGNSDWICLIRFCRVTAPRSNFGDNTSVAVLFRKALHLKYFIHLKQYVEPRYVCQSNNAASTPCEKKIDQNLRLSMWL